MDGDGSASHLLPRRADRLLVCELNVVRRDACSGHGPLRLLGIALII